MPEWVGWTVGGIVAGVLGAISWVLHTLTKLPIVYVPRDQLNARFEALKFEMHRDIREQEGRMDKRFEGLESSIIQVHQKLDRLLERIEQKADR